MAICALWSGPKQTTGPNGWRQFYFVTNLLSIAINLLNQTATRHKRIWRHCATGFECVVWIVAIALLVLLWCHTHTTMYSQVIVVFAKFSAAHFAWTDLLQRKVHKTWRMSVIYMGKCKYPRYTTHPSTSTRRCRTSTTANNIDK